MRTLHNITSLLYSDKQMAFMWFYGINWRDTHIKINSDGRVIYRYKNEGSWYGMDWDSPEDVKYIMRRWIEAGKPRVHLVGYQVIPD